MKETGLKEDIWVNAPSMNLEVTEKTFKFSKNLKVNGDLTLHVNILNGRKKDSEFLPPEYLCYFNVQEPIEFFTGREEFISYLHKLIDEDKETPQNTKTVLSQLKIITGEAGIGKSETIRQFIHLYKSDYDHIVWIDAENLKRAEAQFWKLAREIRISLKDKETNEPKDFEDIIVQIYRKLGLGNKKLLIVFDNAESLDDDGDGDDDDYEIKNDVNGIDNNNVSYCNGIRRFLPGSLPNTVIKPVILVTSRNREWKTLKVLSLNVWTVKESVNFILKQLKLKDNEDSITDASDLSELCGRLPIDLKPAINYISLQSKRKNILGKECYGIQKYLQQINLFKDENSIDSLTIRSWADE